MLNRLSILTLDGVLNVIFAYFLDTRVNDSINTIVRETGLCIFTDFLAISVQNVISGLNDMYFGVLSQELWKLPTDALEISIFRRLRCMLEYSSHNLSRDTRVAFSWKSIRNLGVLTHPSHLR